MDNVEIKVFGAKFIGEIEVELPGVNRFELVTGYQGRKTFILLKMGYQIFKKELCLSGECSLYLVVENNNLALFLIILSILSFFFVQLFQGSDKDTQRETPKARRIHLTHKQNLNIFRKNVRFFLLKIL